MKKFLVLLGITSFFFIASCSVSSPRGFIDERGFVEAEQQVSVVSRQLSDQSAQVTKYRTLAHAEISKGLAKNATKYAVVYSNKRLRMEVFATELNTLLAILVTNNGQIKAFDQRTKTAYIGESSAKNIWQLFTLPFSAEELALFIVGRFYPSISSQLVNLKLYTHPKTDLKMLTFDTSKLRFKILITETKFNQLPLRIEAIDVIGLGNESLIFSGKYQYHQDKPANDSPIWPTKVSFFLPNQGLNGDITFENIEDEPFIELIEHRLFSLEFPSGIDVVDLDSKTEQIPSGILF